MAWNRDFYRKDVTEVYSRLFFNTVVCVYVKFTQDHF